MRLSGKKQFFWFLATAMILNFLPLTVLASGNDMQNGEVASGTYGDVEWFYESSTETLTISGSGDMEDAELLYDDYNDDAVYEGIPWSGFKIRTVWIADGVTGIGIGAFWNCSDLTGVHISDTVTYIGRDAFCGCMALKEITIPKSVVSFEGRDIGGDGLERIVAERGNPMYSSIDGVLFNADQDTLLIYPSGRSGSYTVPDGTEFIQARAFYSSLVTDVVIPSCVRSIGSGAFSGCSGLQSAAIQDGVIEFGDNCFRQCTQLKQIVLPDSITAIPDKAFYGCKSLSSVSLGSKISSIGVCAFINCDSLMEITVPGSVEAIGNNALGYIIYDNYDFYDYDTVSGFVIRGYSGTAAETYAKKNNIIFQSLEHGRVPKISSLINGAGGVRIKWTGIEGITGYRVYRKTGSESWTRIGSTESSSFTDKTAENGIAYRYTVRGISADGKYFTTDYDRNGKTIVRLRTPSISSLRNVRSGKLMVKWDKNSKATGYQIQYSTNSGFIKAKTFTVSKNSTVSAVLSGLKKQKKYYVRIRSFKNVSGAKYYSGWSASKNISVN